MPVGIVRINDDNTELPNQISEDVFDYQIDRTLLSNYVKERSRFMPVTPERIVLLVFGPDFLERFFEHFLLCFQLALNLPPFFFG